MIRGPWSQLDEIVSHLGEERTGLCICDASTLGAIELGVHGSNDIVTKIQEQEGSNRWHHVFVVLPNDWEFTTPQITYFEQRLAEILYFCKGDLGPKVGLFKQWPELSEAQEADVEMFVAYTRLLTRELGGTFLDPMQGLREERGVGGPRM